MKAFLPASLLVLTLIGCGCPQPKLEHPEMVPQGGTWEKPATDIGVKVEKPWSATTIEASVEGKAREGAPVTAVGEIVDLSCYVQLGKHGAKHRTCAQGCMKNSQPIGLLTREGQVYVLMPEEHHPRRDGQTSLKDQLIDHAADIVRVHGTYSRLGHLKAIYISGSVAPTK